MRRGDKRGVDPRHLLRRRRSVHRRRLARSWRRSLPLALLAVGLLVGLWPPLTAGAAGTLTAVGWGASSTTTGASSDYFFYLTISTAQTLTALDFTLPAGTTGTPSDGYNGGTGYVVGKSAASGGYTIDPTVSQPTLTGTTLSLPFSGEYYPSAAVLQIEVTGLTNTATAGSYSVPISTEDGSTTVDSGTAAPVAFSASSLTSVYDTSSATTTGSSVSYSYSFATSSNDSTITSVSMTVPAGTSGTPSSPSSVSPTSIQDGTLSWSGDVATYTFPSSISPPSGTAISIVLGGLTNPAAAAGYVGDVATFDGSSPVDTAVLQPMSVTAGALTSTTWAATPTSVNASGAEYAYSLTVATASDLTAITATVPPGTSAGSLSATATASSAASGGYSIPITPTGSTPATLNSSDGVLTYAFTSTDQFPVGAVIKLTVSGFTNTGTTGSFASTVTTWDANTVVDSAVAPAVSITAAALSSISFVPGQTATGASNVSYAFDFTVGGSGTPLTSVTMSLPPGTGPSGTSLSLGTVSPSDISGGTASISGGDLLTYTFPSQETVSGAVVVTVKGITNTSTPVQFTSTITALDNGTPEASGSAPAVSFTSTVLTNMSWEPTATETQASDVAYTYNFTTATPSNLTSFTMTVPPGTTATGGGSTLGIGTVNVESSSSGGYAISLSGESASISTTENEITFGFTSTYLPGGAVVEVQVTGITNTSTAGSYQSTIDTYDSAAVVDTGTTPAISFTTTSLSGLSWSASPSSEGSTAASYTYTFALSAQSTLASVQMGVPPGTSAPGADEPGIGTINPPSVASGGQVSLDTTNDVLTYTFSPATLTANQTVTLTFTGFTNTSTPGNYGSTITVFDSSGNTVASGVAPDVTITSKALGSISWTSTSNAAGTTGVDYTYDFTTASAQDLTSFTMTVPAGTTATAGGSTLGLGTVSVESSSAPGAYQIALSGESATISSVNSLITFSFTQAYLPSGAVVSVQLTGITNTSAPGTYSSAITTYDNSTPYDSGTSPPLSFSSAVLGSPSWSTNQSGVGQTDSTYTYSFGFPDTATLTTITMTVPAGTGGSPTVVSATPSPVSGGSVAISGQTLVYTLAGGGGTVNAGSTVTLVIGGITNTSSAGTYSSTITTSYQGTAVASGATGSVSITQSVLSALSWTSSSSIAGATGVSYTFGFTTGAPGATLTAFTMTVPPGTGGTPSLAATSTPAMSGTAAFVNGESEIQVSLSPSLTVSADEAITVVISGLTNTSAIGSYTSSIACLVNGAVQYAGSTPSLTFYSNSVTLTVPSSLSWSTTLNGFTESVVDVTAADQQYSVADNTGQNAGWNVSVSATTFSDGSQTLPNTGVFSTNGSTSSPAATVGPTVTCVSSCVAPTNDVTYPVAITTAPSAPTSYVILSAAAGTGSGSFLVGGSTYADPVGWWVAVPPTAYAGTYSSTLTFAIGSGP